MTSRVDPKPEPRPKPRISFFCPAYYDEGNISKVALKALDVLARHASEFEIVIVDDGSPDKTGEVADRLAARYPQIRVVHHETNRGYGEALKTGFREADGFELVAFTDGDDQFDFHEVEKMLPLMPEFDAVIGYRLNNTNGFVRYVVSRVYNMVVRLLYGVPFRDISCSLKVFRRSAIDAIEIEARSPFVDAEIALKLLKAGFRVAEVGIHHYPRLAGSSHSVKLRPFFHSISELFGLWLRYRKQGYSFRKTGAGRLVERPVDEPRPETL